MSKIFLKRAGKDAAQEKAAQANIALRLMAGGASGPADDSREPVSLDGVCEKGYEVL